MKSPTSQAFDVDREIERIAALPKAERRRAFFHALEQLTPHSREHRDFVQLGRIRLAPGPYYEHEYRLISGIDDQVRGNPEDLARQAVAAELIAIRTEAANHVFRLQKELERLDAPLLSPARNDAERGKLVDLQAKSAELVERLGEMRAFLEDAERAEINIRPHRSERQQGAARNWLRAYQAGMVKMPAMAAGAK